MSTVLFGANHYNPQCTVGTLGATRLACYNASLQQAESEVRRAEEVDAHS